MPHGPAAHVTLPRTLDYFPVVFLQLQMESFVQLAWLLAASPPFLSVFTREEIGKRIIVK